MSEHITRAREALKARGGNTTMASALDEVLARGQAAEEGLARDPFEADDAYLRGYRRATLELAGHLAEAILRAAAE